MDLVLEFIFKQEGNVKSDLLTGLLVILLASLLSCDSFEVPAKDIIKKINNGKNVYYKNATIKGHLDFTTVKDNVNKFRLAPYSSPGDE